MPVPDLRDRRGIRYPLVPVLAMSVCAMLAGARSYAAIAEWAADAPARLRLRLGLGGSVPDLVTIWRVLTSVDPAALDRAIGMRVRAQLAARRPDGRVVLAVDGKTVRGARTSDGTAPHLLACPGESALTTATVPRVRFQRGITSRPNLPGIGCNRTSPIVSPVLTGGDIYAVANGWVTKYDAATGHVIWRVNPRTGHSR